MQKGKKVEILRIVVKRAISSKTNKPIATTVDTMYDTNQVEEVKDILSDICEEFGLYCISIEKAEELGLDEEDDED